MPEPNDPTPDTNPSGGNPITAAELTDAIGSLKEAFAEGVSTLTDRIAAIEEEVSGQRVDWNQQNLPQDPPTDKSDANAEMRVNILDKPVETLAKFVDEKNKPLVGMFLETKKDLERMRASARYADWGDYEAEITELEKSVNPAALANPGAYDALYKIAKGSRADDAIKAAHEAGKKETLDGLRTFSEGESAGPKPPPDPEKVVLDPEEEAIRKQFGHSKEEWIRHREVLVPAAAAKKEKEGE